MNKIYSLLILLHIVLPGWSQLREWNGGNGNWNDATNWTPMGIPLPSDTVVFTTSATISSVPGFACRMLWVTGANIILNSSIPETNLLLGFSTSDTALLIDETASLSIGNNLNLTLAEKAQAVINGELIVTTNRTYTTAPTGSTRTIVRGTLKNNGGTIISSTGSLKFTGGSRYEHARDKGIVPEASWEQNSNCHISGIQSTGPEGLNQIFGNYIWDCEHQVVNSSFDNVIPTDISGNLVINKAGNGVDANLPLPAQIKIGGALIVRAGTVMPKGSNSVIELGGDLIMEGGSIKGNAVQPNADISIYFNGTQEQGFSKTGGTIRAVKFAVRKDAALDLGESILDGEADFSVEAGGKLLTAHPGGISVAGNSGAIQVKGKRIFSNEADYAYTGTVSQVTGTGLPASVRRVIIDNKSGLLAEGGVKLSKPTIITSELVLSGGFLQTTIDNILTIAEGGEVTAGMNGFVAGPMRKTGNTAFTFPTGWAGSGGGQIPIGISLQGASATVQAEYKRAPATNRGATINAPLHHISYCEYWELFPTEGTSTAIITMYHNAHSNCNPVSMINDFSSARVARSGGKAWSQVGKADDSLTSGIGYVVSGTEGVIINKEEIYFALGNITTATDPLPVMFDNVTAYEKENGVNVEWSNLTERDIAIYYVERSSNGMDYTMIGQYLPKSNRDDKASYINFDPDPAPGTNFYRIKAIEKSTKIIFSKVLRVETVSTGKKINIYPNPVVNKQFVVSLSGMPEGRYDIRVINMVGQKICQNTIISKGNFTGEVFKLPASVASGLYNLTITGNNIKESKLFIVQ